MLPDSLRKVLGHRHVRNGSSRFQRGCQARLGPRLSGARQDSLWVWRSKVQQQSEVEPLNEREDQSVLERSVQSQLYEEVFDPGDSLDLPGNGHAPSPEAIRVDGKDPGRGEVRVELCDGARRGVVEGAGVVSAGYECEARFEQDPRCVDEGIQDKNIHVGHGSFGDRRVEALGQGGPLHRERPNAPALQEPQHSSSQIELPDTVYEEAPSVVAKCLVQLRRPVVHQTSSEVCRNALRTSRRYDVRGGLGGFLRTEPAPQGLDWIL